MYNMEQGHTEFTIRPGEFELFGSTKLEIQYAIGHKSKRKRYLDWSNKIESCLGVDNNQLHAVYEIVQRASEEYDSREGLGLNSKT